MDVEDIIDEIKNTITNKFNSTISEIFLEKNDIRNKPTLQTTAISILETDLQVKMYNPHIYILLTEDFSIDDDFGGHNIKIEIWYGIYDDLTGKVDRYLLRGIKALMLILRDNRYLYNNKAKISFEGITSDIFNSMNAEIKNRVLYATLTVRFKIG